MKREGEGERGGKNKTRGVVPKVAVLSTSTNESVSRFLPPEFSSPGLE